MIRHPARFVYAATVLATALLFAVSASLAQAAPGDVDFGRQIRPLLADKCFACHGLNRDPDETDLQMDTKQGLFAKLTDGSAIVAGKPEESLIYQRLVSEDEDERMPPADYGKKIKPAEIELIKNWIKQGAPWEQHWSLVAPKRAALPKVSDTKWAANEIDRFVLARLEAAGLTPSAEADKATLIRRVTFDLTGLPPTIQEVDAFLADNSPQAFEKVVDRLLKSPHYGEHMARYWLDAARYADTHGLHFDAIRQIWPYRDWVVRAFNSNMPFDRFTIEQLAGDLLPNATIDQRIATGFNRLHVTTNEGGVIQAEFDVQYTVDRVATMSTVWMGISMGCVVCHEHKFDPFEMKDFYQLYAFFNNLDGGVMDGNKPLPPPTLQIPNPANQEQIAQLAATVAELNENLETSRAASAAPFAAWEQAQRAAGGSKPRLPTAGLAGHWTFDDAGGDSVACTVSGVSPGKLVGAKRTAGKVGSAVEVAANKYVDLGDVANFDSGDAFSYGAWINVRPGNRGSAVISRMNDGNAHRGWDLYLAGDRVIAHVINTWPSSALKVETQDKLKTNQWQHVLVTYDGSAKAAGIAIYINGKKSKLTVRNNNLSGTTKSSVSLKIGRRTPGSPFNGLVDEVRIYNRQLTAAEASSLAGGGGVAELLAIALKKRSPQQTRALVDYYLANHSPEYQEISARLQQVSQEKASLESQGNTATLVWKERAKPRQAYILIRGAYDKQGEPVSRNTPASLPPLTVPEGKTPTRLDLAKWLVSKEHPLTARVNANRFWQQYFGVGIVETTEDLGSQGKSPTHPQLLDYLAVDFRESGWDVKQLQKQIVMSATYRQSSKTDAQKAKQDPNNRLFSRGPRFRLDAEVVRDNALALAGLLVRKIGGPPVKPYQPAGIWKAVGYTGSNTSVFRRDSGEKLYRRTIYTFWKRTAPPPTMAALDAPSRETCTVRRSRTNTPLAALALMNDEQFVEAARQMAARVMKEGGKSDRERATYAFRLATSRRPSEAELAVLLDVYKDSLTRYQGDSKAAAELIHFGESKPDASLNVEQLAAWTIIANLILNLDETIKKG